MQSFRYSAFLTAACLAIASCAASIVYAVERVVTLAFLWIAAAPAPRAPLSFSGPALALDNRTPLDPALLNSMRHEAGMRPLHC